MNKRKLLLLELNEVNFDVVSDYLSSGIHLPGFKRLLDGAGITTVAEGNYHELEPWIQWPSVHTGQTYTEHEIFRLGDVVNYSGPQIFETIERAGFSVGAISPMNTKNDLKRPTYFIPDPWTKTASDGGFLSRHLSGAISQAVNDNARSKLTLSTALTLAIVFFFWIRPSRYVRVLKAAVWALRKPWRKALFLDIFLYEIHSTLFARKDPSFSTLFLNAGAHIQHHYFFNSRFVDARVLQNPDWYISQNYDPVLEMLKVYDGFLSEITSSPDTEVIVATGLSQKPYEELKFYYRLKNHVEFLTTLGLKAFEVTPRMTRDFLVSFRTPEEASAGAQLLAQVIVSDGEPLFGEIDNRGQDLFVVLTYPFEVKSQSVLTPTGQALTLDDAVVFVAIKNGEHQGKGFAFFSRGVVPYAPPDGCHVAKIHDTLLDYFLTFNKTSQSLGS